MITVTVIAIPSPKSLAIRAVNRACALWEKAASRPRKRKTWEYVQHELYAARDQARLVGALTVDSDAWTFVTDRMWDANYRAERLALVERDADRVESFLNSFVALCGT